MQNIDVEKAIPWNPWHGSKKVNVLKKYNTN